jgi:ABC-type polysaccharide/polyol phosphate export permease
VYITPPSSVPYLAGRCLASFASSLPITAIALGFAYYAANPLFATRVPLIVTAQSVLMVVAAMVANLPAALGLGFLLGCYSIFVSRFEWALPGYIAGTLMLLSEALFPTSILPWPMNVVADALPFTYFMRSSRAALISGSWAAYTSSITLAMIGGTIFLAVGLAAFMSAEGAARRKGFIDRRPT